ncbi:MAG: hypothetical protein NT098_00005, partial [Candidatus Parcubacteria bacterium]|nr:hypothetical protein [Candidatus Parcubacteria bacterium]
MKIKPIETQNIVVMLDDAMKELKENSKMHGGIEKVIYSVKSLLTEKDKELVLPVTVKRKIIKLITLTAEDDVKMPLFEYQRPFFFIFSIGSPTKIPMNEYRRRLVSLAMDIVIF